MEARSTTGLHKISVVAILLLCVLGSLHVFVNSITAFIAIQPESLFDAMKAGKILDNTDLDNALELLDISQKIGMGNPRYSETANMMKLIEDQGNNKERFALISDNYLEILSGRPAWPYTWLGFLLSKVQASSFDHDFDLAFAHTLDLVDANIELYLAVIQIGLTSWLDMSAHARTRLVRGIERHSGDRAAPLRAILKRSSLKDFVCASMNDTSYESLCS